MKFNILFFFLYCCRFVSFTEKEKEKRRKLDYAEETFEIEFESD